MRDLETLILQGKEILEHHEDKLVSTSRVDLLKRYLRIGTITANKILEEINKENI